MSEAVESSQALTRAPTRAEKATAQPVAAAPGISVNVLLIALAFFFVLCVVAGVGMTHDRFGDPAIPRSLK